MKITVAYLPEEQQKANDIVSLLRESLAKDVDKVTKSDRNPPFKHTYLTTKKPRNH